MRRPSPRRRDARASTSGVRALSKRALTPFFVQIVADDESSFDPKAARKKAMDYLARREHGRAELVAKLEKAGFDPDVIERTVDRLVADGLQSDARFVEAWISSRIGQGKGPERIRAELRQRHVADAAIEQGIAAADADWVHLARAARERKFGRELPGDFRTKAKQMRFLQYRGFETDQVRAAVSTDDD